MRTRQEHRTGTRAVALAAVVLAASALVACSREPSPESGAARAGATAPTASVAAEPALLPPGERRTFELEGGVRVEVLAEGSGAVIGPGDEVALHYTISYVPKPPAPPEAAPEAAPVAAPDAAPNAAAVDGASDAEPAAAEPQPSTPDGLVRIGDAPVTAQAGAEGASAEAGRAAVAGAEETQPAGSADAASSSPAATTESVAPPPGPPPAPLEPVVVATTRDFGAPVRVRAGRDGPLLPALSRALLGLRAGTVARITLPADQAYGAAGLVGSGIPGDVTLEAEVRVRQVRP